MKGDFTRSTYKPEKKYSGVRMQQGRVQLDADWNEQIDINSHRIEKEARDTIGRCGAPLDGGGFKIYPTPTKDPDTNKNNKNLTISHGRIYVDGILCENYSDINIKAQEDHPTFELPTCPGTFLAYLDVWERHITAIEDLEIREVALGGPDTATRTKTIWQVKLRQLAELTNLSWEEICRLITEKWNKIITPSDTKLTAFTVQDIPSNNPCIVPPGAGYRGLENQLYRVEIHTGGKPGEATFKWSRDNGSVVFAIEEFVKDANNKTTKLRVKQFGKDKTLSLKAGDWVEVLDDATELSDNPAGTLAQITENPDVAGRIITLSKEVSGYEMTRHPRVRRWDQGSDAISVIPSGSESVELEDGIFVQFSGTSFKAGDYWLIPARTATGDIEWPKDETKNPPEPIAEPPEGIWHHFCRLAVLKQDINIWSLAGDCRKLFPAVTELTSFFHVSGDGQEAMPGDMLLEHLQVGVSNGKWPIKGAHVQFKIIKGNGTLSTESASNNFSLVVETGPDGVAKCKWTLGDMPDNPPSLNLHEVPGNKAKLREFLTHEFFNDLAKTATIDVIDDKNIKVTDEVYNIELKLNNKKTRIQLKAKQKNNTLRTITLPVKHEAAELTIISTESPPQQVEATLLDYCATAKNIPLFFNANLSVAGEVAYNPRIQEDRWKDINEKSTFPEPNTVQEAIDNIVANMESSDIFYRPDCGTKADPTVRSLLNIPTNSDSKLDDILDKLLCEFNATSLPINKSNDLCTRLSDAKVETVQDALNVLCKGMGGCAVTVGAGGKYESLYEAIAAWEKEKQAEMCICLLPGTHDLKGLQLSKSELYNLKIVGCGQGTRINLGSQFFMKGLGSFTLRDVRIEASFKGETMVFENCARVTLESCHLENLKTGSGLLIIGGAERIYLRNNKIKTPKDNPLAAVVIMDGGADTIFEDNTINGVVSLYSKGEKDIRLTDIDLNRLAELLHKDAIAPNVQDGTLVMKNNRLTGIVAGTDFIQSIKDPCKYPFKEGIPKYFKTAYFTNNTIEMGNNQIVAQHISLVSNSFIFDDGTDAGAVFGDSAVFMGNRASNHRTRLFNISRSNKKAANLINIVDMFSLPMIWDERNAPPVPYIWNVHNFAGFYFEINDLLGKEELRILQPDLSADQRTIDINNLVYSTGADVIRLKVIEQVFKNDVLAAKNAGLKITSEEGHEDGNFLKMGFLGESYVALNGNMNKLAKLVIEQGNEDKKTMTIGETWSLGSGYKLTIKAIDARTTPRHVFFTLLKDGAVVDEGIGQAPDGSTNAAKQKAVYNKTKTIMGETDALLFTVYVENIFSGATSDMVQFRYAWLIDETSAREIKSGDKFGVFKVVSLDTSCKRIVMKNTDTIVCLSRGAKVNILGESFIDFKVADRDDVLRFMPFPGYMRGPIWNEVPLIGAVGSKCYNAEWNWDNTALFLPDITEDNDFIKLDLLQTDLSSDKRTIESNKLVLTISARRKMLKVVQEGFKGNWVAAKTAGLKRTESKGAFENGSYYFLTGHLPFNSKISLFSDFDYEQKADDKKIMKKNDKWPLGGDWILEINDIDVSSKPQKVSLKLTCGNIVNVSNVDILLGGIYTHVQTIADETDVPLFVTYVDSIFSENNENWVELKYTWAISPQPEKTIIWFEEKIVPTSCLKNIQITETEIILKNERINLDKNQTIPIFGDIQLEVADRDDVLRFMPRLSPNLKMEKEMTPDSKYVIQKVKKGATNVRKNKARNKSNPD